MEKTTLFTVIFGYRGPRFASILSSIVKADMSFYKGPADTGANTWLRRGARPPDVTSPLYIFSLMYIP